MQRTIGSAVVGALGIGAMAVAVSVAGVTSAQAAERHHANNGQCGQVGVAYSLDGGASWTTSGRINGSAPGTIEVKLTHDVAQGCQYPVSLASYSAQGPTWQTSGEQAFLGWDTTVLKQGHLQATLDVSTHLPSCFGQIDLYGNGNKYDGVANPLPHYPDSATPTDLITAWNGSAPCSSASPSPSSPGGSTAPAPGGSGTPSPVASGSPSSGAGSPSSAPSASASASAPATATAAPSGTPSVPPSSTTPTGGGLAETGGNGTQTAAFAGGGAVLLLVGAGAVIVGRRRRTTGAR
ncbi:LAETG motif-containing sortase-dependent surface protein [Streptomyces sp. ICBB 8177]|uniref:LAETG motif-containing sortase-dependent surface protein n=1 Tax=Streptomyces sp. ICBB 8177 TaxID=563922 RepID=UPI000D67CB42|nr:LAETG motif-containing sortase-dependent surface protein [Streptomyces sp. ICBB 8177]PWI42591.1 hypothetical protein CK485_09660 [Streptomyces sp. ICBB 8177]